MSVVIVGCLADSLGAASQLTTVPYNGNGRNFDVRRVFSSTPSTEYRSVQAAAIAVDVNHDRRIGELKYLERTDRKLWGVCEIDGSGLEGPLYFSPSIRHRDGHEIELRGLAVTKSPASVGLEPLSAFPGTLRDLSSKIVYQDGWQGRLVKNAYDYDRKRKRDEPIVIQGVHAQTQAPALERSSSGQLIEIRSATAVDVNRARRELDLLIAPAEQPTTIYERARSYVETFVHGAFAGVERAPEKVRVNRDHVRERVVGKAVRLDPWDEAGLTGTVKLSRVHDADEALALIADDLLGVSAGFAVAPGGDEWHGRSQRRVRRALLDHVSLVAEAAYPGARVTAVRSNPRPRTGTPNLDQVRALLADVC